MIIKVAEACALKRAFSISGLVTQEEMDVSQEGQRAAGQVQREAEATYAEVAPVSAQELAQAIDNLQEADGFEELRGIYLHYKHLHKFPSFVAAKDARKIELETAQPTA